MKNMTCLLAHPRNPNCVIMSTEFALTFASSYIAISNQIITGDEDEVTPLVRQRVYETLCLAIKHYPPDLDNNDLIKMTEDGMTHKNRTARLSAGSVFSITAPIHIWMFASGRFSTNS